MRETSHFDGVMITNIHQGIFKKRGLPIVRESGSEPGNFCSWNPDLQMVLANVARVRTCLHGGGGPQVGEVTHLDGVTRLSI